MKKANQIYGRAFLDVDLPFLMTLKGDFPLSISDRRRLAQAIRTLRPVKKLKKEIEAVLVTSIYRSRNTLIIETYDITTIIIRPDIYQLRIQKYH